jgi:hypothetical protein
MQTLTREELSLLLQGGIEVEEPTDFTAGAAITYKLGDKSFVQVSKGGGEFESYRTTRPLLEEVKAEIKKGGKKKIADKIAAEKLKPVEPFIEDVIEAQEKAAKEAEIAKLQEAAIETEGREIVEEVKEDGASDLK